MLSAVDGAVELVVDRPYKAGDPIVVWYDIALVTPCLMFLCRLFLLYIMTLNLGILLSGVGLNLIQNCL